MLWAAYPSVCPSVCHTAVLCQNEERRRKLSLPPGSTVPLVFWCQEWLMGDDPVQIKVECKEVDPCENSRAVHISPHNFGTVIDSGNSSVNANRKSNMGFSTSHQPRSCVTPNFPKMVFRCPNLSFFRRNFDRKTLQVCCKVSFCLKSSSGKIIAQSTTTCRTVSTFWQGMTPFP